MARKKVVDTEEFRQAVAVAAAKVAEDMVASKMDEIVSRIANPAANQPGGAADLLGEVLSKLSMNMAALGQQGQRNKPLSPEEIARREAATLRLEKLIMASREDGTERPAYRLIAKTYLNERFIEPYRQDPSTKKAINNEVTWTGIPNDAMVPINRPAEEIFAAWRESTGGPAELVPTADRRPLWVTAAGLTVRGEPPKRQHVSSEANFTDDVGFRNGDPNAPEIAVLGTVAAKAKQNAVTGVGVPR